MEKRRLCEWCGTLKHGISLLLQWKRVTLSSHASKRFSHRLRGLVLHFLNDFFYLSVLFTCLGCLCPFQLIALYS